MRHVYPEAIQRPDIEAGPWLVVDGPGLTDLGKRTMSASLGDGVCACGHDHNEAERRHELLHVAFTPTDWHERTTHERLPLMLVQSVEDARLGAQADHAGFDMPATICPKHVGMMLDMAASAHRDDRVVEIIMAAGASRSTRAAAKEWTFGLGRMDNATKVERLVDPGARNDPRTRTLANDIANAYVRAAGYADWFVDRLDRGREMPFDKTIYVAAMIHGDLRETAARRRGYDKVTRDRRDADRAERDAQRDPTKPVDPSMLPELFGDHGNLVRTEDGYSAELWYPMEIERPPLDRPARALPTRRWTSRREGIVPGNVHRVITDGKIFRQEVRNGPGYVLLVDCSGSMHLSNADVRAVLDAAPATTIALYSTDDERGVLRVVADKGRRANDEYIVNPSGGNDNGCDGLALRWLAKQKGKRVWMSDGHVTGASDARSFRADATEVVVRASIMRVETADDARDVIAGKTRWAPSNRRDAIGDPNHF